MLSFTIYIYIYTRTLLPTICTALSRVFSHHTSTGIVHVSCPTGLISGRVRGERGGSRREGVGGEGCQQDHQWRSNPQRKTNIMEKNISMMKKGFHERDGRDQGGGS